MKTTFKNTFAVLIMTLLSMSCNSNDYNPATTPTPTPVSNNNFIRCNIDGVAYKAPVANILADQNTVAWNFRSDIAGGVSVLYSGDLSFTFQK